MLAKKTSKNQITLPKAIAESFPDAQYFDVGIQDGKIVLLPVKILPAGSSLAAVREKMRRLGVSEEEVGKSIEWARGKKQ